MITYLNHLEKDFIRVRNFLNERYCALTAQLEPLSTHPDHRGKKLAQELMKACYARLQELGATKMPMTGGFDPFYEAIGFKKIRTSHARVKRFDE